MATEVVKDSFYGKRKPALAGVRKRYFFTITLFLLAGLRASAQEPAVLSLFFSYSENVPKGFTFPETARDSTEAVLKIKNVVSELHRIGYAEASADSVRFIKDHVNISLHIGKMWFWKGLLPGNVPEELLREARFRERDFKNKKLRKEEFEILRQRIIEKCENSGYPFAKLSTDSLYISDRKISLSLNLEKGAFIRFDTLIIQGDDKLNRSFWQRFLHLEKGRRYSEKSIRNAEQILRALPYLKLQKPVQVIFEDDNAYPVITVQKQGGSQLDGIIGFLPNEQENGRLLLTGQLTLNLQNAFGKGKRISLEWQQILPQSPTLDAAYEHPNIFNTGLDAGARLELLKQDTTFLNVDRSLLLKYRSGKAGVWSFSAGLKTGSILSREKLGSGFLDTEIVTYGLGYERHNLEDYFYPRRGYRLNFSGSAGNKKVRIPNGLDLPEDLQNESLQVSLKVRAEYFWKISSRLSLLTKIQSAALLNDNLLTNELLRTGGLRSFRGFNENFFYASSYGIFTGELRLYTARDAFLFAFADNGLIQTQSLNTDEIQNAYGIGAGMSFSTKAGVFNFAYALGQSRTQNIGLNNSKIHFGLVSVF